MMKNQYFGKIAYIIAILTCSLSLSLAHALDGSILERGTGRKITFSLEDNIAIFELIDGGNSRELRRIEITEDWKLKPWVMGIGHFEHTHDLLEGYDSLTIWLIEKLDMGIIFLAPISASVYLGYSTGFLYTIPADLLSKENATHRKYIKLVRGEEIKASRRIFNHILSKLETK